MSWKTAAYLGAGVLLGLALNATIAGFANPLLANLKLDVTVG